MQKLIKPMISIVAAFVIFLTFATAASAESGKTGVVTAEILNVRQSPATTSKILKKLPKGIQVSILSASNGWYKITATGTTGWVTSQFITVKVQKIPQGTIKTSNVNLRSAAGTSYSSKGQLAKGEKVTILGTAGDWLEVKTASGKTGWIRKDLITLESDPITGGTTGKTGKDEPQKAQGSSTTSSENNTNDSKNEDKLDTVKNTDKQSNTNNTNNTNDTSNTNDTGSVTNGGPTEGQSSSGTTIIYNSMDPNSVTTGQSITTTTGQSIVTTGQGISVNVEDLITFAKSLQGVPYVYGGMSLEGFDCSGFTSYVFASFGVKLNRVAADQATQGIETARDGLKPGDLVFFDTNGGHKTINHTGIYIGEGKFIHASSGSSTYRVTISDLATGFYFDNFMTARNILN